MPRIFSHSSVVSPSALASRINRTAAGLIPYLMINEGMSEEDATDKAMHLGLRSPELLELAMDFVRIQSS